MIFFTFAIQITATGHAPNSPIKMSKFAVSKFGFYRSGKPLEAEKTAEGFLLTESYDVRLCNLYCACSGLIIFGGVFFLGFTIALVSFLLQFLESYELGLLFYIFLISILLLIEIIIALRIERTRRTLKNLLPSELIFSEYPLHLGGFYTLKYRRALVNNLMPKSGQITSKLFCYKWKNIDGGDGYYEKKYSLWESDLKSQVVDAINDQLNYDMQIHIPPEGSPSFYTTDNQIRWELQVTINLPKFARDTSYFVIQVLP